FEYAGFALLRHLEQQVGWRPLTRWLWEELAREPDPLVALDRVVQRELDRDLGAWFTDFAMDQAFACGHRVDPDLGPAPCTIPQTSPLTEAERGEPLHIDLPDTPLAATVFALPADGQALRID